MRLFDSLSSKDNKHIAGVMGAKSAFIIGLIQVARINRHRQNLNYDLYHLD